MRALRACVDKSLHTLYYNLFFPCPGDVQEKKYT
jgi:hypothetical protein